MGAEAHFFPTDPIFALALFTAPFLEAIFSSFVYLLDGLFVCLVLNCLVFFSVVWWRVVDGSFHPSVYYSPDSLFPFAFIILWMVIGGGSSPLFPCTLTVVCRCPHPSAYHAFIIFPVLFLF
jgi:hypothetical protein